ncbi:hypothetical protein COCON_G00056830 [Conger conger]|uniref:Uncharacterized protein n=1 Tax=Conger conger TaxID=82655 RepID=A0A9Q1DQI3_CONCO|nr:hypothetical protein COCON_G00056830 [Conger conger]
MSDWNMGLVTLREGVLSKLADLLDNPKCGWRQLADAVNTQPQFRCSEKELIGCSVQVLSAKGSPSRLLLAKLADRAVSLSFLLQCLKKIEHREAVQFLTSIVEQIRIAVQPQSQRVPEGGRVVLSCQASGLPGMGYQWFKGKDEVPNGSAPDLILNHFSLNQQGYYICRVNHGENFVFSQWAQVTATVSENSSSANSGGFFPSSASGLIITQQPRSLTIAEGDSLCLECRSEGNPPPQYQWYHNKQPLLPANKPSLKVPRVTTADRGKYSCRVYNFYHEVWSDQVHVEIGPGSLCGATWDDTDDVDSFLNIPTRQLSHFYATDKVALLVGNMNYQYHRQLRAPMADVHELTNLLRQLDFKVVSLLDLNRQEMYSAVTEFLLLLDRGVYGLLYFAGHGYENYGNSFMVPIDAPASYTSEHCLWVQDVLQRMQERETGLNVFLLDMCRKRNLNDDIIQQPGPLKVTANIVFGYATCVDAEVNKDDLSNGIFISFLKKRLLEEEKVTVMLDRVAEDMGQCEITRGRQALELRSNLSERRALTDRIQSSDCPVATSARNLQWSIAHVLPDSRHLLFDCGVKVQLGFAAEFSNIMIIYTRILDQPQDIISCTAQLSDFSEGVDVDLKLTNQENPWDAGSLLFTLDNVGRQGVPKLYTRLRALQRLKMELKFTVCLHYQYSNMDEEVQEKQTVTVGKPLVAKLNLHEPRLPRSFSASSSGDLNTFSLPESSSFPEGLEASALASETSSLGSASTCWSYFSQVGEAAGNAKQANVPEETLSPEFLEPDQPQPLSAECKSMPQDRLEDQLRTKLNFHSC